LEQSIPIPLILRKIYFYEIDLDAIEVLHQNIKFLGVEKDVEVSHRDLTKAGADQFPSDIVYIS